MNWKTTISEIQAYGLTQPQIAAACGCAQATNNDLANEKTKEPRHSLGQSLLRLKDRLHFEAVNKPASAPAAQGAA
jgi:hypothetical protein